MGNDGVRVATYNTLDLWRHWDDPDEVARHDRVSRVIAGLVGEDRVDVVVLQELFRVGSRADLCGRLTELAAAVGMTCWHTDPWWSEEDGEDGKPAVGVGAHGSALAMLWRPDRVRPMPDSFRVYDRDGFFHTLATIVLGVPGSDGREYLVRHADFHATPFGNAAARADECGRVASALTRPDHRYGLLPGVAAADWNLISSDRVPGGGFYDPDPYAGAHDHDGPCTPGALPDGTGCTLVTGVPWHDQLIHQACWRYDDRGRRAAWWANRQPGEVLYAGGLYDAAAALGAPWRATTGHWPSDRFPPRRQDGIRVTRQLLGALRGRHVVDTELTRSASDHLPEVVAYDPAAMTGADQYLAPAV